MRKKNIIHFSVLAGIITFIIACLSYRSWYLQKIAEIEAYDQSTSSQIKEDIVRKFAICKSASKTLSTIVELYNGDKKDINVIDDNFLKIASAIDNKYGSISRMQLAKNNIIQKVFPETPENMKLINFNLSDRIPKKSQEKYKNSRICYISGPVKTTLGWQAFAVRNSIFTKDNNGMDVFWGSASVMIKIDDFIKELQLDKLSSKGIDYQLYQVTGSSKVMIAGSKTKELENCLQSNIMKFQNNSWILKLDDSRKDKLKNETAIMILKMLAISFVVGFAVFMYSKQREKLMERARINLHKLKEAKEYDRVRTEFFANISHEFRTPINIILSAIKMLDIYMPAHTNYENIGKIVEYKNIIKKNCYRLLRIIGNLIDVTKLDVNFMELNLVKVNIVNLIEDITLSVSKYCESKSVELIFDTDVEEKYTMCDQDKIDRIMLNLLSNAVKFTRDGDKIEVNVYDKQDYVEVSVKDTGIGIPQDKQKMIFERFRQVNKSLSREQEGSGIGLSLVKSLVELHGGEIRLISQEGKGSEFIFTLPIKIEDSEAEKDANKVNNKTSNNLVETIKIEFSDLF